MRKRAMGEDCNKVWVRTCLTERIPLLHQETGHGKIILFVILNLPLEYAETTGLFETRLTVAKQQNNLVKAMHLTLAAEQQSRPAGLRGRRFDSKPADNMVDELVSAGYDLLAPHGLSAFSAGIGGAARPKFDGAWIERRSEALLRLGEWTAPWGGESENSLSSSAGTRFQNSREERAVPLPWEDEDRGRAGVVSPPPASNDPSIATTEVSPRESGFWSSVLCAVQERRESVLDGALAILQNELQEEKSSTLSVVARAQLIADTRRHLQQTLRQPAAAVSIESGALGADLSSLMSGPRANGLAKFSRNLFFQKEIEPMLALQLSIARQHMFAEDADARSFLPEALFGKLSEFGSFASPQEPCPTGAFASQPQPHLERRLRIGGQVQIAITYAQHLRRVWRQPERALQVLGSGLGNADWSEATARQTENYVRGVRRKVESVVCAALEEADLGDHSGPGRSSSSVSPVSSLQQGARKRPSVGGARLTSPKLTFDSLLQTTQLPPLSELRESLETRARFHYEAASALWAVGERNRAFDRLRAIHRSSASIYDEFKKLQHFEACVNERIRCSEDQAVVRSFDVHLFSKMAARLGQWQKAAGITDDVGTDFFELATKVILENDQQWFLDESSGGATAKTTEKTTAKYHFTATASAKNEDFYLKPFLWRAFRAEECFRACDAHVRSAGFREKKQIIVKLGTSDNGGLASALVQDISTTEDSHRTLLATAVTALARSLIFFDDSFACTRKIAGLATESGRRKWNSQFSRAVGRLLALWFQHPDRVSEILDPLLPELHLRPFVPFLPQLTARIGFIPGVKEPTSVLPEEAADGAEVDDRLGKNQKFQNILHKILERMLIQFPFSTLPKLSQQKHTNEPLGVKHNKLLDDESKPKGVKQIIRAAKLRVSRWLKHRTKWMECFSKTASAEVRVWKATKAHLLKSGIRTVLGGESPISRMCEAMCGIDGCGYG